MEVKAWQGESFFICGRERSSQVETWLTASDRGLKGMMAVSWLIGFFFLPQHRNRTRRTWLSFLVSF